MKRGTNPRKRERERERERKRENEKDTTDGKRRGMKGERGIR